MHDNVAAELKARLDNLAVSDDYGPRSRRRREVIALYAGYAPIIPIYAVGYDGLAQHGRASAALGAVFVIAMLICFAFFAYGFSALLQNTYVNAPNIRDERLDERWLERRNAAVLTAFRALGMILAAAALYAELALSSEHFAWMRNPYLVTWFLWLGAILGMTLPTAIMAWTEPDPMPD